MPNTMQKDFITGECLHELNHHLNSCTSYDSCKSCKFKVFMDLESLFYSHRSQQIKQGWVKKNMLRLLDCLTCIHSILDGTLSTKMYDYFQFYFISGCMSFGYMSSILQLESDKHQIASGACSILLTGTEKNVN